MARLTSYDQKNNMVLVNEEERLLCAKGYIDKDEMYKIMMHLVEKLFQYEEAEEKETVDAKNEATHLKNVIQELENLKKCYLGEEDAVMKPVSFEEYIQEILDITRCLDKKGIYIPIKVGDTVYIPCSRQKYIKKAVVEGIFIDKKNIRISTNFIVFSLNDIGVTIFLTEEDAKKNLESE